MTIENIPPMLSEEENEKLIKNWNGESWKVLAEHNMRLALKVANSFLSTGIDEEDLYSISLIGLIKAAKKFNPKYKNKFSTYAIPAMRNEIFIYLRNNKSHPYPKISLNEYVSTENGDSCELFTIVDSGLDFENYIVQRDIARLIHKEIQKLKERDRKIILMHLDGICQMKIGETLGLSQPQISRVLRKFKAKVRKCQKC